jgi:predicted DNA-binding transcriptional regulator AlpA
MDIFIPTENDFRKWIKESLKECVEGSRKRETNDDEQAQMFLNRKQVASTLNISLVTLTDWMKKGLPYHKPNRRVYFIKDEVLEYIKSQKAQRTIE